MFKDFSLGIYEKAFPPDMGWKECFTAALHAGYEFVELSIDETDERLSRLDWEKAECLGFLELQYELGIRVPTMCLSGLRRYPIGSHVKTVRETGMEVLHKAIRLASMVGIRVVQIAGYDVLKDEQSSIESASLFHKNLGTALGWAEKLGIVLGIENMGVPFMDSLEKILKHVAYYNSPYLKAYADVGNLFAMNKQIENELQLAKGHIVAIHLKDTIEGVCRDIPFSKGKVDFLQVFHSLRNIGYRGMLLLEMWNKPHIDNVQEIANARLYITEKMKQAGMSLQEETEAPAPVFLSK